MAERIVLIGAGSAMFTRAVVAGLIARRWRCQLVLVDTSHANLQVARKLAAKMVTFSRCAIKVEASTDRRAALKGATSVICAIGVGGRPAWVQDVLIPRKFGIYQSVGDAVGPGGASRLLRTVPAMVDICRDIADVAPHAVVLSYTNPLPGLCLAVQRATGVNIIGLCHGTESTAEYLPDQLKEKRSHFAYSVTGYNHFSFFTEARLQGICALESIRATAARRQIERNGNYPQDSDPLSWDLSQHVGYFPANGDAHVAEFFPHMMRAKGYYGRTLGMDAFSFEDRISWGADIFDEMKKLANSDEPLSAQFIHNAGGEQDMAIAVLEAIRRDKNTVVTLNVPNVGQIPNLPTGAIVESPCVVNASGYKPILQKPLNAVLQGMLLERFAWCEKAVQAALEGSRHKFIETLMMDGLLNLDKASELADQLIAANAPYLRWMPVATS